jgi:acetate---CoA ligase (ADP-forming)
MLGFLSGLSEDSRALRFFSASTDLIMDARAAAAADGASTYGLVAVTGADSAIVGHAEYIPYESGRAELAFAVADAFQGRGLATILLGQLAAAAETAGITTLTAQVLPRNHRMIDVFRESGFPVEVRSRPGELQVELPASLSEEVHARFRDRERIAAVAAVRAILEPHSVALVGASRRRGTVGGELLHNLVEAGFTGLVHPINPNAESVQALRAYPSVGQAPGPIDLAVIAIPAAHVVDAARDCAAAGVRGLVVISSGFAETGPEGQERQTALVEVCRQTGMRLVGPNCLGVLDTAARVRLNATFALRQPPAGSIAFLSQSGGLGIAIVEAMARIGLGLSSFVSVGNRADISGNDLLEYWEQDAESGVIALYLESFGNARKFARLARRVAATKPIVAVKSGRSGAGARAASSHTGALLAASDVTVDALFRQAGVIRTDTLGEMFDVAGLLASQPVPRGARVAIVTNAGGPGILCADACEPAGLEVAPIRAPTRRRLAEFLPADAGLGNPVDMLPTASAGDYRMAIDAIAEAEVADAIIVIFVPPLVTGAADVVAAVREAAGRWPQITLAAVFMAAETPSGGPGERGGNVPTYEFPEDAARAVAHAAGYGRWRAAAAGTVPRLPGCDADAVAAVIAQRLEAGEGWLAQGEVDRVLACYGLPLVASRRAADPAGAADGAAELAGPVALKAIVPGLVHKTEAGAVRLGVAPETARAAAEEMRDELTAAGRPPEGFVVQAMAPEGVELLAGIAQDPSLGPLIACGAGGITAELTADVAVRITPLTDVDAAEMLRSLRMLPLLEGYRGRPACDLAAIEDILLRLSALVEAHPEVVELDLNPVRALPRGAVVVDARVRVAPAAPPPLIGSLDA